MKKFPLSIVVAAIMLAMASVAGAQTTYTLNGLGTFGSRGDGSVQPGDSIGTNPQNGNTVAISAQFTSGVSYGVQPGDAAGATNGFNMRGITFDPVSSNLVFIDTHSGSGGSASMATNSAIYILDRNTGLIIGALNTNGMQGGSYTHVVPGVADDGVVYVCNQTTASTTTGFKIYRWATADINSPNFSLPPVVSYTNILTPVDRLGETMDVRGAGTNTQILVSSASTSGGSGGTNIYLFTTTDGTNFTPHRIFFTGNSSIVAGVSVNYAALTNGPAFGDGVAFGPTNTLFAKNVGGPLLYLSYDPVTFTGSIISEFNASSVGGNDPLLNLAGIAVDNVHHLLAAVEEISGVASGGPGKVWLFDIPDPTNHAPAILASRTYIPNFVKATATMGYVHFGGGKLYANVVNNGMLASSVDLISMPAPTFTLPPDQVGNPVRVTDLPTGTRVAVGQTAHFEVFATPDVTNYQWYSNNIAIAGATAYFLDIPNCQTNFSGSVYKVIAANAAASVESVHSTLAVVSAGNFFHPVPLWSYVANNTPVTDPTNYLDTLGGSGTPNARSIAYNAISNQLLVVRGGPVATFSTLRIVVANADTGAFLYTLKTNGIVTSQTLNLCAIVVADDGAVYASSVSTSDQTFKIYRWADTGSNTLPQLIFGTNSSAANSNPVSDFESALHRFGDAMAVRGAGNNTEIILDCGSPTRFAGILRPVPDNTMTNWTSTSSILQNTAGSYGFQAYGTGIGRSLQFGPTMPSPLGGNLPTFWQKRYNAGGAPLAIMSYNPGGGVAALNLANTGSPLFTNGPMGFNFTLNLAAAVNFSGPVGTSSAVPDTLDYYDVTDPSQAVLLSRQNLPGANAGGHLFNANAIAQVIFGANPNTGTNYIFVLNANNGLTGYYLSGGVTPPPKVLAQPRNLRVTQGSAASLSVQIDQLATIQWYKGTNSPVNTGITGNTLTFTNAQPTNAGDYFVIANNLNGTVTSAVANVSVVLAGDNYSLTQIWGAISNSPSFPYVTATGGANTPTERSFAYNAVSNQLIVVSLPVLTHSYFLYVVDALTGSNLYTMNTTGVVNEGASEVNGSNPLDLCAIAAADDGAIYVCSLTPNASGGTSADTTKMLHIYRWADSGPATVPTLVYQGDPSGQPPGVNLRWGDVMAARGSGTNTQLLLNSHDGAFGGILVPTDGTLTQFTNRWFADSSGSGSIGRSIQFGATNTVYEKRKGATLFDSLYNTNTQTSSALSTIDSTSTLGGVFVNTSLNLAVGVDFVGSATAPKSPDAVALYDISVPTAPLLINRYNFPSNQVANANFISQSVIAGLKVFSLDGNNGLVAFYVNPPSNSMVLKAVPAGASVNLSWGSSLAILQGTPGLAPTTWTDLSTLGQTNSIQSPTNDLKFYRLIVRR